MKKYKDKVLELKAEGWKNKEIAEILDCSLTTVTNYVGKKKVSTKDRNRKFLTEYLKTHPCIDCGNSDLRVLDFDHVKGEKFGNVSHSVKDRWPIERLIQEIEKCEIRCSNCHRIVTYERRKKLLEEKLITDL